MIVESHMEILGVGVRVACTRVGRGYTAELRFEGGDRALLDAATLEDLERLVEVAAQAAVEARRYASGTLVEGRKPSS